VTAYLDASVILRIVFGESAPLVEWDAITKGWTSALTRVECARTLDRIRHLKLAPGDATGQRLPVLERILESLQTVELDASILTRACQPLPVPLGTLDALHLASALAWREQHSDYDFAFATHDRALGKAARTMGLTVIGTD